MKLGLAFFAFLLIFLLGCASSPYSQQQRDDLATCFAEKEVKMYGAFWCPSCAKQKKIFGSSWEILVKKGVYVECDARGDNPQSDLCMEKKVDKYPDWEIKGERMVGIFSLETLAEKSGCPLGGP